MQAMALTDKYVYLHDPAGYPHTRLPMDALIKASNSSNLENAIFKALQSNGEN